MVLAVNLAELGRSKDAAALIQISSHRSIRSSTIREAMTTGARATAEHFNQLAWYELSRLGSHSAIQIPVPPSR